MVFLRFLTPYLAVHDYLSSPHAVQPSAEIALRISYFRLSTVDFQPPRAGLSSLPPALPCRSRVPQFSACGAAECGDSSPNILLSTFNCRLLTSPRGSFLVPIPARNPFNPPHLQLSLDRDRNHVVICSLILRHHSRRPAPQAAPLRNLCVLRVSALDFSSLGLTLNLQPSTFNRVSFLSPSS